jgi:hypothetical protein
VLGGLGLAAVRGLAAWRSFRRFRRRFRDAMSGLPHRIETTERRLALAGETAARLDRARAELERSLATARVLADAASEAKDLVDRLPGFVPRR